MSVLSERDARNFSLRVEPRSSRAAATIAPTFAAAVSQVFIGRLENVPKPQSGFRKIVRARRSGAPPRPPRGSRALDSTVSVRGLTTPRPSSLPPNGMRSPARSVAYSSTSCVHVEALEIGRQRLIAAGEQRRFIPTPVAPAHVHADPHVSNAFDDPVDQRHGELEFLGGIPPRRQRRAHERARAPGANASSVNTGSSNCTKSAPSAASSASSALSSATTSSASASFVG